MTYWKIFSVLKKKKKKKDNNNSINNNTKEIITIKNKLYNKIW